MSGIVHDATNEKTLSEVVVAVESDTIGPRHHHPHHDHHHQHPHSNSIPTTTTTSTMGTIQHPPRYRHRVFSSQLWVLLGLAGVVLFGLSLNVGNMEDLGTTRESLQEVKGGLDSQRYPQQQYLPQYDRPDGIEQAPIQRTATNQKFWDQVLEHSDQQSKASTTQTNNVNSNNNLLSWVGWKSTNTANDNGGGNLNERPAKRKKMYNPIPVIEENDDRLPNPVSGTVVHAADALTCRKSVLDYVINATDLKDECHGLTKAYTKHCGGDSDETTTATVRQRSRQLTKATSKKKPIVAWKRWLHRKVQKFRRYWRPKPFWIEDRILGEWEGALEEVENNRDLYMMELRSADQDDAIMMARTMSKRGRRLQSGDSYYDGPPLEDVPKNTETANGFYDGPPLEDVPEISETANEETTNEELTPPVEDEEMTPPVEDIPSSDTQAPKNKTKAPKEKQKLSNLELPTTKQHVSEKMLSETLLLHQEDKIIADVKAATSNATATAVADAAQSTKAMSDTFDFVSRILNDPTSVEARACCTSILNVFHEACSVDAEEEISDARLFIVVAVIALCGMVKSLIRHFQIRWLPEAAGCILVGVVSGWALSYFPHHDLSFDGKWFLRILVPPIVFEAALSIDKRSFNRHVVPIMFYAVVGTLLSSCLTALIVYKGSRYYHPYCEPIPIVESLAFGSLISSIDPIAVLSVLSNMGMANTDTIYVVIFGESLLNDGVAIVLYQTIVQFLDVDMEMNSDAVTAATIHFLVVAVGSLLVGLMGGICCTVYYWIFHGCQTPLVEVLTFCCWALLPYYICDGIEWSGIVAVVAAGFVMDVQVIGQKGPPNDATEAKAKSSEGGRRERRHWHRPIFSSEGHLSKEAKVHIGFVTEIIATMVETVIFAYLGLFLFSSRYHWNIYHVFIAVCSCCLSRAIMIPSLSAMANWVTRIQQVRQDCRYQQLPQQEKNVSSSNSNNVAGVVIDKKMQLVLWFAGLRGAMSFALIEDIPPYDASTGEGTRLKSELKAMTSACIIFTVFVLGGLTYYMMDSLGMAPTTKKIPRSVMAKDAELAGLLGASFSSRAEDNTDNDDSEYDFDAPNAEMPVANDIPTSEVKPQGASIGNRFRQRSPQPTAA